LEPPPPDLASIKFSVEVLLEGNGDPDFTGTGILDCRMGLGDVCGSTVDLEETTGVTCLAVVGFTPAGIEVGGLASGSFSCR